jgi:hypothetical protein
MDSVLAQVIFAFVMIGLFALVLRWAFKGEAEPASVEEMRQHPTALASERPAVAALTGPEAPERTGREAAVSAASDDYGLLVPAATVDTDEQATRIRDLLSAAGIRATTSVGSDGRRRVLVFPRDLGRARRVAGSSN